MLTDPAHGRWRRWVLIVAVFVCAATTLADSPAQPAPHGQQLRVLQMNLCNSGAAGCFTGRSVAQAAAVIHAETPDVVTLNEVCENDVTELAQSMTALHRTGTVATAFQAAVSRRTGGVVRCRNGQSYGIGLLVYVPGPDRGHTRYGGVYPMQDTHGEQRVWLCLYATDVLYACTTHLADDSASMALAQCEYLLNTAIPAALTPGKAMPTIVGGDLNLGAPAALPCLPSGYARRDDGAVQQIMASADLAIDSSKTIDMRGATDHAGLFVALDVAIPGA